MSKTIHRTLDVLDLLVKIGEAARLTDLAEQLGEPKANIYRTLSALERRGYISHLPDDRYRLGIRCFELGYAAAQMQTLNGVARPLLERLSKETQETVHLAVYDSGSVIYVDKVDSPLPVAPKSWVGMRAPATAVATGRAILAYSSSDEIDRLVQEGLTSYTAKSITDGSELKEMLEQVRVRGIAANSGSWREGVSGVAAPIRDYTDLVVASVGCCVPDSRFDEEVEPRLMSAVAQCAEDISRELGYRAPVVVAK